MPPQVTIPTTLAQEVKLCELLHDAKQVAKDLINAAKTEERRVHVEIDIWSDGSVSILGGILHVFLKDEGVFKQFNNNSIPFTLQVSAVQ